MTMTGGPIATNDPTADGVRSPEGKILIADGSPMVQFPGSEPKPLRASKKGKIEASDDQRRRSPSAWSERVPLLCLAALGLLISAYLGAVQVGAIAQPWDPIFGNASSIRVLHSIPPRYLPIPDAILGVFGYAADLIVGGIGGRERWRYWPGLVLLFGLVIFGLALVSVLLILMQTLYLHTWCTLCLCSALISLAIYALGSHEVLFTIRHLLRLRDPTN
jgi:uncharacterized membrane protein